MIDGNGVLFYGSTSDRNYLSGIYQSGTSGFAHRIRLAGRGAEPERLLFGGELRWEAPIALEAVRRFDTIFDAEREFTGLSAEARHDARQRHVAPMVNDLHD